ncbi:MAG TPA: GFA family protein [Xanthomonadales bacterium]|nr:GFA family protein [Xanthomonadales bacterium]
MPEQYKGGCHCGGVRYTCAESPDYTFYCHCRDCQRTTGSPMSMELMVKDATFKAEGTLTSYVVTGDSGKPVTRHHCPECGSGVYLECASDPGFVFIKVGSLDDASWVSPQMHIFTASKQPWLEISDGLPQFEGMPEE